jgi:hypothetical protein
MSVKLLTITAIASFALVFLNQGKAEAGFLVEHDNAWHSVGDNVGSGPISSETSESHRSGAHALVEFLSQFLTRDAAQFGRIGCSTPGGMSSSASDSAGQAGSVFLTVSLVRLSGAQCSMLLGIEGSPRLPPPLATMILQPPRA